MANIKVENNFIWVILAAIRIYSTNFLKFCGYMLFPVMGQVMGLLLIFSLTAVYSAYLPGLIDKYAFFRDPFNEILCLIVIIIPGLLIFLKAFWDYLVAYGAINSVTESFLATGKVYDFPAHKATVEMHSFKFIVLWMLYSLFIFLSILIPFLWLFGIIFFIYFVLVFQVFSFEPEVSASGCFKRSLEIIRGNAFRTILIMLIIGAFTHILFVQGFSVIFDITKITLLLGEAFENTLVTYIPIDSINEMLLNINSSATLLTSAKIAEFIVYQIVAFLVIGFTLPLRSITWALWYKALVGEREDNNSGKSSKKGRRVIKKLSTDVIERAKRKNNG